jgi:tRNA nucleotidyltransferase (CCA-adding enzyme)
MHSVHPIHTPAQLLERLAGIPGGPELLDQARRREDVALVGGAVRDLLLGHWPRELDVTVETDPAALAHELAGAVSPSERAYGRTVEAVLHERFGTASVTWQYGRIDIARRRAESYSSPGALPDVRPGTVEQDLERRDFTVNAIALPLHGRESEGLVSVDGALQDLRAGVLRVLHERSFLDDPTRILRMARYAARLRFEIEPHTRELAERAVAEGALDTVSGARLGAELWLAAREDTAREAIAALDALGVPAALGLPSPFDDELAAAAEALLPGDGQRDLLLLAVALHATEDDPDELVLQRMERLEMPAHLAKRVLGPSGVSGLAARLAAAEGPEEAYALLDGAPVEAVAVAGALAARSDPAAAERAAEWLSSLRHVSLSIDGSDLLAAGVPEGPEVGARLDAALRRKREGALPSREHELRYALADEAWEST